MYSCHLFLISSASVRSIPFLSFLVPIFAWNVLLVSLIFLKGSLGFPLLLFSSISLHWSLRKAFLSLLAILWNSAFRWVYLSFPPLVFTENPMNNMKRQKQRESLIVIRIVEEGNQSTIVIWEGLDLLLALKVERDYKTRNEDSLQKLEKIRKYVLL